MSGAQLDTLKGEFTIFIDFFFKGPTKTAPQEKNHGTTEKGLSWCVSKLWGWQLCYNSEKWTKNGAKRHILMKKNH